MKWNEERVYFVCGCALYPLWGLISSALLFTQTSVRANGTLVSSIAGICAAGVMPVGLHLYEVGKRRADFSWSTVFLSLFVGGIAAIMFGTMLQAVLLICGVHSILGLPIDQWWWKLPLRDDY